MPPESRLTELYNTAPEISIDYAVMEKSDNIVTAEAAFDWDDVGSWISMRNQILPEKNNNVVRGLHAGLDTSDCIIIGNSNHLIATVDVKDLGHRRHGRCDSGLQCEVGTADQRACQADCRTAGSCQICLRKRNNAF